MDALTNNFIEALREAIRLAGTQAELAKRAGMQQSRISDYLSCRYDFDNITVGTLKKLFPEIQIQYFPTSDPQEQEVEQELEKQVIVHFRHLSSAEKARYMMLVAANFPEKLKQNDR